MWPFRRRPSDTPSSVAEVRASVVSTPARRARTGGRVSVDTSDTLFGSMRVIIAPPDAESSWRLETLDSRTLDRITPTRLIELLADLSPDISRALWDLLRLLNPGWELKAYQPSTDEEHTQGQAALDAFVARLTDQYGSVDVVFGRLFLGAYVRGAFMAELVLDEAGREPVDIATPDPASARFAKQTDPLRGEVWQLGQWQNGKFVPLDQPTIRYVPVDPMPGKPYGRAPAAPALFTTLFLLGLLRDLRRVVSQQGYPRIDLEIISENLLRLAPADVQGNPEALAAWISETVTEIQTTYAALEPDDAYVHSDVIKVGRPVGTVDSSSLGAIDGLVGLLERMATRALKTMPLLMGSTEGTSEANANRQAEQMGQSVKTLQHLCESTVSRLCALGLEAQGIQARVELRFAEFRGAQRMRDAQTRKLEIENETLLWAYGLQSQDAAAQALVGHDAEGEPLVMPGGGKIGASSGTDPSDVQAEPGSDRKTRPAAKREANADRKVVRFRPLGADDALDDLPDEVTYSDADRDRLQSEWDRTMLDFKGLLDAKVVGDDD